MLWGWMQIEDIIHLDEPENKTQDWMKYHPHFYMPDSKQNTLYIGSKDLTINEKVIIPNGGTGTFDKYQDELQLTRKGSNLTDWIVPAFLYNDDEKKRPTYHQKEWRWKKEEDKYNLRAVSKGQEFVSDCEDHHGAMDWIIKLINKGV